VPQQKSFFGAPWVAAMMGMVDITGPTLAQACATGARTLCSAASAIELGEQSRVLAAAADRTSNGPQLYYPNPKGPGGHGEQEAWILDNFNDDPVLHVAMLDTAEKVAIKHRISREQQDEVSVLRYQQYLMALENDAEFQRRYMLKPMVLLDHKDRVQGTVDGDEGIVETTPEGVAKLRPIRKEGTITFAHQTHPADGHCAVLISGFEQARALNPSGPTVQFLCYNEGRAEPGYMGEAPVPAAQKALVACGLNVNDLAVIKTHNPFAVNDIYFAQEMKLSIDKMNNYGSSLIYGHPQGPTGIRLIIEMIEELEISGGGYGLFSGCAAGDSAAAVIIKVS
jgi:acetyl-CoA acetyltransferase